MTRKLTAFLFLLVVASRTLPLSPIGRAFFGLSINMKHSRVVMRHGKAVSVRNIGMAFFARFIEESAYGKVSMLVNSYWKHVESRNTSVA